MKIVLFHPHSNKDICFYVLKLLRWKHKAQMIIRWENIFQEFEQHFFYFNLIIYLILLQKMSVLKQLCYVKQKKSRISQ